MQLIALDFETYFDNEYTLKKLTTEAYIRDPRFEVHGCAIRRHNETLFFTADELPGIFALLDWSNTAVLCHHAHFDGLILSHHYGIKPARWLCTLSMGRHVIGNHIKLGLESLAQHFGLQPKSVPYDLFRGKHWWELTPEVQRLLGDGACHDVELSWDILMYMMAGYNSRQSRPMQSFPDEEYRIIDMTVRMFTEPRILGDIDMLAALWVKENNAKQAMLQELGVTLQDLRSDDTFAELLALEGVELETKITAAGNEKYAFAKTDDFMRDLVEGEELPAGADEYTPGQDRVRLLAEARLQANSALQQTRAERLGWMARRGPMTVYINYCGAHTTRDSGGDKINWQNDKRGSDLRRAKMAPKGQLVAVIDASQIECRILNTEAGQEDIVQAFREKRDLYSELASQFYGFTVTKAMPKERGTGKQLELSCGYGSGGPTIVATAKKGTYGPPVILTPEEGERAKDLYRNTHGEVKRYWLTWREWLKAMNAFQSGEVGALRIECDRTQGSRRIVLPNGAHIIYDTLEWHHDAEQGDSYWRIKTRKGYAKLYGAKVTENVISALARTHMMQVSLRIEAESGFRPWLRNHDELAYLIPDDQHAEPTLQWMLQQMRTVPSWLPADTPLDAEGSLGERYEK